MENLFYDIILGGKSNIRMSRVSIRNILTIRYDITKKHVIKPATMQDFEKSFSDPHGHLTEKLLNDSFKKIKKFDRFSVSLSGGGGIDSSLCLALLRKNFPKARISAISGVFENTFDESMHAKKIAEKFDADFHPIQMESIYTKMPEIIYIARKPRWNTYHHLIAKHAKKFSKILVTGDGGDELFGGYTFRYKKFLNLIKPKDTWKSKVIKYLECHNRDWVPDQEFLFNKGIKFNWNEIYNYFKPYFKNQLHPLNQVMLADFNGKLLHDFIPTGNAKHGFSPSLIFDWKKFGKDIFMANAFEKKSNIYTKKIINRDWIIHALERIENDGDIRYLNRITSILALEIWYKIFIKKDLSPRNSL